MQSYRKSFWRILTIRCEDASLLASESIDRKLDIFERAAVRSHQLVCASCRQYEKQINFLRQACLKLAERERQNLADGPKLSDSVKQKLKAIRIDDEKS